VHVSTGLGVVAFLAAMLPLLQTGEPSRCETVIPAPAATAFHLHRPSSQLPLTELNEWCSAVGPSIVELNANDSAGSGDIAVVSWNVHGSGGDVTRLVRGIRDGSLLGFPATRMVLLLQEVVRRGDEVPLDVPRGTRKARPLRSRRAGASDIRATGRALGLNLAYVPSMRNGTDREDRGNAVLSTLPFEAIDAFELPLGRQRRVAVAATIAASSTGGSLRFVSVHLDTGLQLGAGGPARWRQRQAKALIELLGAGASPIVVGGDLNTWWGPDEPAVRELRRAYPEAMDRAPRLMTWQGPLGVANRLDYLFGGGWGQRIEVNRIPSRFGSDHTPVFAWLPRERSPRGQG
jgi:endonuclease/exonuclease/phosphatase family metal-dependent hydrolase